MDYWKDFNEKTFDDKVEHIKASIKDFTDFVKSTLNSEEVKYIEGSSYGCTNKTFFYPLLMNVLHNILNINDDSISQHIKTHAIKKFQEFEDRCSNLKYEFLSMRIAMKHNSRIMMDNVKEYESIKKKLKQKFKNNPLSIKYDIELYGDYSDSDYVTVRIISKDEVF
jgi:hypothetical protein